MPESLESVLNMTGNHRPENEAGIDVQENRPEDFYETTVSPLQRKK